MNSLYKDRIHRASILNDFFVQLAICTFFGVLLPPLLYFNKNAFTAIPANPVYNSIVGSFIATSIAIFLARKVTTYPGVKQLGPVFPSFLLSFGGLAIFVLSARISYSVPIFALNFVVSIATYLALSVSTSRKHITYFAVKGGRIDRMELGDVDYIILDQPSLPETDHSMIVADLHYDHSDEWERTLAHAALRGIPVFHFKQILETTTGQVQIEHLSENSFGSLLPNLPYVRAKRSLDFIGAVVLLPILAVPMLVISILIKLETPGPAFFRQHRVGYRGEIFSVMKFRTMRVARAEDDEEKRREEAKTQDSDPRITPLGAFLRKTRLDEVPQIINILKGEMSWIGPRPEALELSRWYERELPFYSYRHVVRPGITGWAQVNQGHVTELADIDHKLRYDFYYIKHFSYWLDVLITVRTLKVMTSGFGAK